jgi:hypothetical protein
LYILIRTGVGKQRDLAKTRHRGSRTRRTEETQFPDRHEARLIIQLLLDFLQRVHALLAIALRGLLQVPGVELGILNERGRPLAIDEGFDPGGGSAEGAAPPETSDF